MAAAAGKRAVCAEGACPFWEPGGAALNGRCALERLDVATNVSLATWLLEFRETLERTSSDEDERAARHVLHRLLNDSPE